MKQHVHVATADPEGGGDILTGLFIEEAQHHDGLLRLAELIDTRAKADVLLGLGNEVLDRLLREGRRRKRVEVVMRASQVMTPALVACGVADDPREVGRPFGRVRGQLFPLGYLEEGAEGILDAFDRVLRG